MDSFTKMGAGTSYTFTITTSLGLLLKIADSGSIKNSNEITAKIQLNTHLHTRHFTIDNGH